MSDEEIKKIPIEVVSEKIVNQWGDMLLNIYYGMKYPDEAIIIYAETFNKGMNKYGVNASTSKKDYAILNVVLTLTNICENYGCKLPEALAYLYVNTPKRNIETVLKLKEEGIANATNPLLNL